MKTSVRVALSCLFVASCTFGGSDEDPTNGYSASATALDGGGSAASDASMMMTVMDGSMAASDARVADAAADSGAADAGSMCKPVKALAVCDPVANTGCNPFQQCDIDADAKTTQAGRCVSWFPSLLGCDANALTESCDPKNTCVMGQCKKLCYCDSDCTGGTKCTGTAPGPAGAAKFCK